MIVSLPDDASAPPSGRQPQQPGSGRWQSKLARKWAYRLSMTVYVPMPHAELERKLAELVGLLCAAMERDELPADEVAEIGARLVDMHATGRTSLQCTMDTLGRDLLSRPQLRQGGDGPGQVVALLAALAAGYSERLRKVVFDQQESLNSALIDTLRQANGRLQASQAQFDELFARSASGVLLTDLEGRLLRTNAALRVILDRSADELAALSLFDLVADEDADALHADLTGLVDQTVPRVRQWRKLVRGDGETMLANLSVALLRSPDGTPHQCLVIVEDDTELTLLQGRLSHQALHDVLTGLPNRQFFISRLEQVLRQADPAAGVTLFQLDLDAFSLVSDGLGRQVGDRLLCVVAERVKDVFAAEQAMVARFGCDEFAVVVRNGPGTPDVVKAVERINEALGEPVYMEGHGIAASACIGVVHRPPPDTAPDELLRAADLTLRRAKRSGHRQWELFDADRDAHDRERFALAVTMPGAWAADQIQPAYLPIVSPSTGKVVGVEAMLRWRRPGGATLSHEDCLELAEATGLTLPLGVWLMRSACGQIARHGELPLSVGLTPNQAADPDLVSNVLRVLEDTGVRPQRLRLVFPVHELVAERGETVDNVRVLADVGVCVVAGDFGGGLDQLACLEELPICAVRLSRRLSGRLSRQPGRFAVSDVLAELVRLMHAEDVLVVVDDVRTAEELGWWAELGADRAVGGHFAPDGPFDDIGSLLACR